MAKTNFENLRIYQLSEKVADSVWEIVSSWNRLSQDTVGKQLIRAANSMGANIAEGVGRWGLQDQKRFIYIARGSVNETKHWLRRAFKRNLLTTQQVDLLRPLLDELAPKLNAYVNSLTRLKNSRQPSTIDDRSTAI